MDGNQNFNEQNTDVTYSYDNAANTYDKPTTKKGLVSMILGIVALACGITCYGGYVGIGCGIAALILSGQATAIDPEDGKAKLGKTFGIIGLILSVLGAIISIVLSIIIAMNN